MRLNIMEPIIVQENVKMFSEDLISTFLGDAYYVDAVVLDALDVGWPSKRERKWTVCRHKQKILSELSPLNQFVRRFMRICQTTWREYFFAEKFNHTGKLAMGDEFEVEVQWAQNRKASRAYNKEPLDPKDINSFEASLNGTEVSYHEAYIEEDPQHEKVYQLNQNPLAKMGMTSTCTQLMTMIHNLHFLYSSMFRRWMTSSELIVAQGFPLHPEINAWAFTEEGPAGVVYPASSFNMKRPTKFGERKARQVGGQVGNSMHVNVVGIVMLWCLVSPKRVDTLPGMREFSMRRRAHNFGSN